MNFNDNDLYRKFISFYVYYSIDVNVSFLIDMLVYQDWIRTLTTRNCKPGVVLICWIKVRA